MLTASERYSLLERAEELHRAREFSAVIALLTHLDRNELGVEPSFALLLSAAHGQLGERDIARRILRIAESSPSVSADDVLIRRVRNTQAMFAVFEGDLSTAERLHLTTLPQAIVNDDIRAVGVSYLNLGAVYSIRCQWDEALSSFSRALTAYERLGEAWLFGACQQNLGMCTRNMGLLITADSHFERAIESARSRSDDRDLAAGYIERALTKAMQGDYGIGYRLSNAGLRIAVNVADRVLQGEALRAIGSIWNLQKKWREAQAVLQEAQEISQRYSVKLLQAETFEQLAISTRGRGDLASAKAHALDAIRTYREMGATTHCKRVASEFYLPEASIRCKD